MNIVRPVNAAGHGEAIALWGSIFSIFSIFTSQLLISVQFSNSQQWRLAGKHNAPEAITLSRPFPVAVWCQTMTLRFLQVAWRRACHEPRGLTASHRTTSETPLRLSAGFQVRRGSVRGFLCRPQVQTTPCEGISATISAALPGRRQEVSWEENEEAEAALRLQSPCVGKVTGLLELPHQLQKNNLLPCLDGSSLPSMTGLASGRGLEWYGFSGRARSVATLTLSGVLLLPAAEHELLVGFVTLEAIMVGGSLQHRRGDVDLGRSR
ncbi:hypothetical protein EYF80_018454 [Liparis tanakae]|uniref:Uncharacterized protein n=1 Tax=Liparis tanakae TaxID=230148 RepID=A0A4Z2I019_9TELE|nr:hypothetical protein EYF80_018454 [Liparis tanakae]